jgi:hypothetical protein
VSGEGESIEYRIERGCDAGVHEVVGVYLDEHAGVFTRCGWCKRVFVLAAGVRADYQPAIVAIPTDVLVGPIERAGRKLPS